MRNRPNHNSTAKVAAYVRVSTLDQEKGVRSQVDAIQRYLDGHGMKARWYRDRLSGKDTERPAFKKLEKAIFHGEVNTVVVWKLDRLSRSLRDGINLLCDWLEKGVRIVAVSQQLDFSGPTGKMIASLLFAVAEMERENLRENTKRGLAAAKARGVKLGRPSTIDGHSVAKLIKDGLPIARVAERIGASRPAIYNALKRENIDLADLRG